jgi:hypothetical protein
VERNGTAKQEIGVGLLLAGSDAFKQIADDIAAAHDQWQSSGTDVATLEWARRLAAYAAWWCGRLEGEADAVFATDGCAAPGGSPRPCRTPRRRRS